MWTLRGVASNRGRAAGGRDDAHAAEQPRRSGACPPGAGLADILAADNHGDTRCIATALEWLQEHDGDEQALLLLEANPRAILEDGALYEVEPLRLRDSLWGRMRRLFEVE